MIDEKLKKRLQNLLALAKDPTGNPNECANAMALAQRLLFKHNLSEAALGLAQSVFANANLGGARDKPVEDWQVKLAGCLADLNGCSCCQAVDCSFLRIWGREEDIAAVQYLYAYCCLEAMAAWDRMESDILMLARAKAIKYTEQHMAKVRDQFLRGFANGVVIQVAAAVREEKQTVQREARRGGSGGRETSQALAVLDRRNEEAEEAMLSGENVQGTARPQQHDEVGSVAYEVGHRTGYRTPLRAKGPALGGVVARIEEASS